jgi:FtsZ-binding cell division protein ZapB
LKERKRAVVLVKKIALGIVLITVIALSAAAWFVQNQISELQTRISGLQAQNSELQDQNGALQAQVSELQLQNREQQDRLTDFTYELAKVRYLRVEITAFSWLGGFNPIVGVTLVHPVNVTVQNNDVVPLSGLTLTVRLLKKDLGTPIGTEGTTWIDRLNAGETRVIGGGAYTTIGTSLDNAVCTVTLSLGVTVLDEWTQSLS